MKKAITIIMVAVGLAGGAALLMAQHPGDQAAAAQVVNAITDVEDLTGQPAGPASLGPPALTSSVVEAVLAKLQRPERHNGFLGIAQAHGCSIEQVRIIEQERQRRIRELTPSEPVEPHP